MVFSSHNSNSSPGSDITRVFDQSLNKPLSVNGVPQGGSVSSQSLILEIEKGKPVKTTSKVGKNFVPEAKAMEALRSHSQAEKRRRQRINDHLDTLRSLVPCTKKMDKASLLAKVIEQAKELKRKAMEATRGLFVPMDTDDVKVEPCDDGGDGPRSISASLCCDYRPEILSDLRQTMDALQLDIVQVEISTLGCRVKFAFVFTCCKGGSVHLGACQLLATTVQEALRSALDRASSNSLHCPLQEQFVGKRRKICNSDPATSSGCNHSCTCSC